MSVSLVVGTKFTANDKLTQAAKKMTNAVVTFGRKAVAAANMANRAFNKMMAPIRRLGKQLGAIGLTVGLTTLLAVMGGAVNKFAEFEQSNASLASVMGVTIQQNRILADDAKRLGATTAKSATQVVGLQEAYARLGFSQKEILDVTESTIAGSIAMNAELSDTAELTGAIIRTFDKFSSIDAPEILDQMTLATQKSALNFEKLQTALPIVAGAANTAGIPFTKLLALLGKLSDAGIDASSSSTALRNIFIESAAQGLNYDQILTKIVKDQNKLTAANDEFGKRGAVSAVILSKQIAKTQELDKILQSAAAGQKLSGVAQIAASKQLNTLTGRLTILSSAYEGFILSLEDGNGEFGTTLKNVIEVATEVLSLAGGFAKASDVLTDHEKKVRKYASITLSALKIIKNLAIAILVLKTVVVTFNAVAKTIAATQWLWNTAQAVNLALQGKTLLFLKGNKVAMIAYLAISKAVTAAQWVWNAAMLANPIGLIIIAVIALIAIITVVIKKYNEWGAALALFLGPLGMIINLVQSFRRNWEMVTNAFKTGGILNGLKAIGKVILDSLLMPVEQLLKLISKIPAIGDKITPAIVKVQELRTNLGVNTTTDESGKPLNPEAEIEKTRTERIEKIQEKQNIEIDINNRSGFDADVKGSSGIPVNLTTTNSWQ